MHYICANSSTRITSQKGVYPENEKILVVADPEYKYGQNWLACVTLEARDKMLNVRTSRAKPIYIRNRSRNVFISMLNRELTLGMRFVFHRLTSLFCTRQEFNAERLAAEEKERARLKAIADKEAEEEALRNAVSDSQMFM